MRERRRQNSKGPSENGRGARSVFYPLETPTRPDWDPNIFQLINPLFQVHGFRCNHFLHNINALRKNKIEKKINSRKNKNLPEFYHPWDLGLCCRYCSMKGKRFDVEFIFKDKGPVSEAQPWIEPQLKPWWIQSSLCDGEVLYHSCKNCFKDIPNTWRGKFQFRPNYIVHGM